MSEEAEKRLQSVMAKLTHPPKSKPDSPSDSSSDGQSSKGRKRPNPMSASAIESKLRKDIQKSTTPVQAPLCRPWDREDLMKRLATFKSMTWFAKPKVISAVNCARRGWVNVEMDIIACEACGARLLFSTPSSWTQQQVEKAALVFSLKLDNGHKLLCPWMDNACDEMLAQFPPATVQDLVDGYKERSSALLQLVALPLISSAAINHMRSPQLEHFLRQSSVLEFGSVSADSSQTEYLGSGCDAVSANLYFQAQKLINLCGWMPRSLPYVVDSKDRQCKSAKDVNHLDLSHIVANMQTPPISVHSSATDKSMQANEDPMASSELQSEHSVVLECSLCGATVGLWAFSTVERPTEFFRLVGNSEVTGESNAFHCKGTVFCPVSGAPGIQDSGKENHVNSTEAVMITDANGARSSNERLLNLNLTIAGGPPPTEQNFRATISIPVIGQNLRARFSSDHDFRDRSCVNQENSPSGANKKGLFLEGKNHTENTVTPQIAQPESIVLLESKRHGDGQFNATSNDQSLCLNNNISEEDDAFRNSNNHMSLERPNVNQQGLGFPETGMHDSIFKVQMQDVVQSSGQNSKLAESADNVGTVNPTTTESVDNVGTVNPTATESVDNVRTVNPTATENADNVGTVNPTATESADNVGTVNPTATESTDNVGTVNPTATESADNVGTVNPTATESADNVRAVNPTATGSADNVGAVNPTATGSEDNVGAVNPAATESADNEVRDSCMTSADANMTTRNAEISEDDSLMVVGADDCNLQQIHGTDNACNIHIRGGDKYSEIQNILSTQPNSQGDDWVKDRGQIPVNNEAVACGIANDLKQQPVDKAMEFDPIWQHRHFCPWIAAAGSAAPGWQQTLSALQQQKDFSHPSPSNMIKVDDPIASVRKLFMSSSAKRMKPTHGST
ncbi:hypothetical protein PVL29_022211 [Vitis rotundifolia]|uniref:C3HC-type domain-containing protein n=3 Tax=Vitis rotundifolia TaxID=103349 RepID=A0AA38YV50_VITRO|nr:hypothetical protein PVL29_022211 [Vitis rotundifolia]